MSLAVASAGDILDPLVGRDEHPQFSDRARGVGDGNALSFAIVTSRKSFSAGSASLSRPRPCRATKLEPLRALSASALTIHSVGDAWERTEPCSELGLRRPPT